MFNVLSQLTAYQVKLYEDFVSTKDPVTLEETPLIMSCASTSNAVWPSPESAGNHFLQELAWWLNCASLSEREEDDTHYPGGYL